MPIEPKTIASAGHGEIEGGGDRQEFFEILDYLGHFFGELTQDNFNFPLLLFHSLAEAITQLHNPLGFDVKGRARAGNIVDDARNLFLLPCLNG